MKKLLILLFIASFSTINLANQISSQKWEVLDIPFYAQTDTDNPFDVRFGAELKHQDGTMMDIPGFYNDDNEWIIRFTAPKSGTWEWQTYASIPDLAGKKGQIIVSESEAHGPVIISKSDPRKFEYANGAPYFLMAFELDWLFALDWDNEQDIPRSKKIIGHLKDNGFNQVIMNVYAYDAAWGERDMIRPEHNYAQPVVFPFGGSNEKPDYSRLNINFFKHLDRVIAHLDEKEIIAHLMIYVWNKKVNWPESNSKADNMYFDYVVKRYQAFPNLVWDISKEALGYGHNDMNYITGRIDRLRILDGHDRLVTVHDYAYCNAFPDKVDFISIQQWRPNLYDAMNDVMDTHADKPVFNIEHGGYEKTMHSIFDGAYTDAIVCLDRNYQCVFAGTYSTYYWQNAAWYEVVYNPFDLPEANQPKFSYFKHLVDLFSKYDFNRLQPGQFGFTSYCLTDGESVYLFYLPQGMNTNAGDVGALQGKKVRLSWFNPLTGSYHEGWERVIEQTWISMRKPEAIDSPMLIAVIEVIE